MMSQNFSKMRFQFRGNVNSCKYLYSRQTRQANFGQKIIPSSKFYSSAAATPPKYHQTSLLRRIYNEIRARPIQYATIPSIAAFVGISTNYMGVQMLFYPIEYMGTSGPYSFRILDENSNINKNNENVKQTYAPYGFFGWQGVVPARTEKMALRLVDIVTKELLSLKEVFAKLNPNTFAQQMHQPVLEAIERDCGYYWARVLAPVLPLVLRHVVRELQKDIDHVLDLESVVLNAFVRDKIVLVELFQKVGRIELDFLVKSGLGFGFLLGLGQMALWVVKPKMWTLPVAGALVGYVTNWIAIKLLFEPADPVDFGPFVLQGLFESRQVEVSDEFAHFMEERVLSSRMLLDALSNQNEDELFEFLRKTLPWPIPEHILRAAIEAIKNVAKNQTHEYDHIHSYVSKSFDIEQTLSSRLKQLSPKNFENLLHPVFQEDEIILIVVGGVLGAIAGVMQTRLGWGTGKNAKLKAALMLVSSIVASGFFYVLPDVQEILSSSKLKEDGGDYDKSGRDTEFSASRIKIRRQNSLLRRKLLDEEDPTEK